MHWADFAARKLSEREGPQVVVSGITPSGEFHIGHLREILSAEMIHRACLDFGLESRYVFIVDSMDPLRRVYDFLSPSYESYIGVPLANIPAPGDDGEPNPEGGSYAEFFLRPFLEALKQIGVEPEVIMNHETYQNGEFAEMIDLAITNREEINGIIESVSGRELPEDWFPYSPIGSNGSLDGVKVTGYDRPFVHWIDGQGVEGKSDIRLAEGKMPWRIDWAARWAIHGVTCEPAGKDHGAAGGSYDTGIPICKLLGGNPPEKMVYEWIQLKGMGPMSSSSGVTIGPMEALSIVPPEILRYVIARSKMNRHIEFDTGAMMFLTADEYERLVSNPPNEEEGMSKRKRISVETRRGAMRLSQVSRDSDPSDSVGGVSFRHLSMLAQIKSDDDSVWSSLRRSGHLSDEPGTSLRSRLEKMRSWIGGDHFPEGSRIVIQSEVGEEARSQIDEESRSFLELLARRLESCNWDEDSISETVRSSASDSGLSNRQAYVSLYLVILGRDYGPRISSLMAEMDRDSLIGVVSNI
ncbi:MAG: lysine--tRNA ligase [Euryarchaeota archaeon]|nr:lysine--tRNA ligase [Euryarchaeota archaeon]|tara:strand:- start:8351 stop:9925 length:1575 start_codon:yes stop_codon:yes gene_type:complete